MRIEVTYIDTSTPPKRHRLHVPRVSLPKLYKTGEHKFELRVPKVFVKMVMSAAILLILLVGAGIAYTYFLGGSDKPINNTAAATVSQYQPIKPARVAPDAPVGVAVGTLSTPVSPGSAAFMSVNTLPGASCNIAVIYDYDYMKKQQPVSSPSLGPKIADAYGAVGWNWTVSPSAELGKGKATVTCKHGKQNGLVQGDIQVVAPGTTTATN